MVDFSDQYQLFNKSNRKRISYELFKNNIHIIPRNMFVIRSDILTWKMFPGRFTLHKNHLKVSRNYCGFLRHCKIFKPKIYIYIIYMEDLLSRSHEKQCNLI